jgi:outer membrane protein OmpA-like peptidoglycan-associated protein
MKQLKIALIALFAFSNVNAQDENNPWVLGFGINTVDVKTPTDDLGLVSEDYFGSQEWGSNTLPSISRITVEKYLEKGFTLQLAGSVNNLNTIRVKDDADAFFYSIDALVKYDLNNLFGNTGWFDPYVSLGGGYQNIDHESPSGDANGRSDAMLISNIGFNTWFNDKLGLNFQTGYGHHFNQTGYDTFRHSLGLVIRFGGKDTDGDGVYDKKDTCPEVVGLVEFNGCPDADGDGIKDSDDACPDIAGLAAMNGCPDADGDGIADKDDMCPNSKGTKANKGCPDTDGDGLVDKDDKCASVAGPAANTGCPWPDTDGDGVLDKDDKCPSVAGFASEEGCPEVISSEAEVLLDVFATSILFNTGVASFKSGMTKELDGMLAIMNQFPSAKFAISGFTDSIGSASSNLKLSDKRANAVRDYLVKNGISASRLTAKGFGEKNPVASNMYKAGRTKNRRVEVKVTNLYFDFIKT